MRKPIATAILVGFMLVLLERSVNAQFPFGGGMIPGMENFMQGMNTMMSNLQAMNQRLQAEARARQQYIHSILPDLKPGEGRNFQNGTIRGFAYRTGRSLLPGIPNIMRHMNTGMPDVMRHMDTGMPDVMRHMNTGMPDVMRHMNKVKADLQTMSQNLKAESQKLQAEGLRIQAEGQKLGQKIREEGQRIRAEVTARHKHIESILPDLKPGEDRNIVNGTIRGYAYRSPDGHYSYHILTGSQSHGYVYHSGPDGTYERRW